MARPAGWIPAAGGRVTMQGTSVKNAAVSPVVAGKSLPLVSVLVPVRNESEFLASCLDSVLANTYPAGRIEILVIDGMSGDGSRAIVEGYAARCGRIRILDNPKTTTPAALNLGVAQARGELILRLDAHARLAPDYIAQCVEWLEASGADNVGGSMRTLPRGPGLLAQAIALALSHRFGVGGSAFRTPAEKPCWTDTVFGGCYRREVFERIGGFNERLPRGQDMEFNLRLKRAGGRTLLAPSIRCDYFARSRWWPFLRHNWTNGVWAIRPFFESRTMPVRPRHLAPLGFVAALLVAALVVAATAWLPLEVLSHDPRPLLVMALCYGTAAICAAIQIAWRQRSVRLAVVLPLVFFSLHFSYGLGSLWGLATAVPLAAARRLRLARNRIKR
ncbi:MAG: glycosyltransferase family 2 protein [Bryobacterales bacterium]